MDFFTTTFSDDYKTLYRNDGGGNFSDVTYPAGLADPTVPFLGWGTGFLDFDNDGWLDIFVVNGHVYPQVDRQDWGTTWAERPQLFRNLDGSRFKEVPPATGSGLADVITGRGAAFGDLFNEGHIDVVINDVDSKPTLLRNVIKNGNHWLTLKLIGGAEESARRDRSESLSHRCRRTATCRCFQRRKLRIEFRPACSFRLGHSHEDRQD